MKVLIYRNKLLVDIILTNKKHTDEEYLQYLPDWQELLDFFRDLHLKSFIDKNDYLYEWFKNITQARISF